MNPLTLIDFYKADHRRQYPDNTVMVYSNWTPRKSRIDGVDHIVFFGLQYFILKYLIEEWNKNFFEKDIEEVIKKYKRRLDNALGKDTVPVDHIRSLHELGYLPLCIKALPEGTLVPMRVPAVTIRNTVDEHYWLVNYLETIMSCILWKPCTSATTAFEYYKNFVKYYLETVSKTEGIDFVKWQGHDFSARGMSGVEDAALSSMGHLLSFWGTDTVWAIDFAEDYYFADSNKEIVGGSVPATEHSVMCMGTKEEELETVRRLITKLYPSGPISIVWDTWDYWGGILYTLPTLKNEIMNRVGSPIGLDKVIIRPDSGNPFRIIVGYFDDEVINNNNGTYTIIKSRYWKDEDNKLIQQHEKDGSIQCLWDIFGGYQTAMEFRQLTPKIGLIYGDSITVPLQLLILQGLKEKNFASTNVVLGIGSYTYEYVTRDTYGWAMKATYGEVLEDVNEYDGDELDTGLPNLIRKGREIFKNPKTDNGMKKSAKGLLQISRNDEGELILKDQCTWKEESKGLLETIFLDGKLIKTTCFEDIRKTLTNQL
jgi:nicotinamide phosphoribosyltransferase